MNAGALSIHSAGSLPAWVSRLIPVGAGPRCARTRTDCDPTDELRFEVIAGAHAGALALARRRYQQRGLAFGIGGTGERVPGITVLAHKETSLWGTLRLGLDSIEGLQADIHYRDVIDSLRAPARRLAEITRLALEAPCPPATLLVALVREALRHLGSQSPTDLIIEVNPRHERFYVRRFGFRRIGEERLCERVGAPAVLLHRALGRVGAEAPLAA